MTREEKLEEAKRLYKTANADQKYVLERLFPELKESEDERIKSVFRELAENYLFWEKLELTKEKAIAWLEKQGEQQPADKVEPKFKVGDVIRLKGSAAEYTIKKVTDTTYYTNGWSCGIERCEEDYELVEQKPAWSEEDDIMVHDIDYALRCQITYPISKLQSMSNWIFNLKGRMHPQPKQEWSEEEIENCAREAEELNCIILAKHIRQLKSLRPQNTWKPSEEQITVLHDVAAYIDNSIYPNQKDILVNLYLQLKKLREE